LKVIIVLVDDTDFSDWFFPCCQITLDAAEKDNAAVMATMMAGY